MHPFPPHMSFSNKLIKIWELFSHDICHIHFICRIFIDNFFQKNLVLFSTEWTFLIYFWNCWNNNDSLSTFDCQNHFRTLISDLVLRGLFLEIMPLPPDYQDPLFIRNWRVWYQTQTNAVKAWISSLRKGAHGNLCHRVNHKYFTSRLHGFFRFTLMKFRNFLFFLPRFRDFWIFPPRFRDFWIFIPRFRDLTPLYLPLKGVHLTLLYW